MTVLRRAQKVYTMREPWTASLASYDLHAFDPNRFSVEDVSGVKNAVFTVNSGDTYGGGTSERAEVVLGTYKDSFNWMVTGAEEDPEYFRFKVKLASPWERPDADGFGFNWGICFQVHGPNYFVNSPPLSLHCEDTFKLFLLGGDMDNKVGGFIPLTNDALVLDAWVDFVIEVKWSTGTDGYAALYRKDDGATAFNLMGESRNRATLQWQGTRKNHPHYMKTGFYRSQSNHTNIVRIGVITRTSSRETAFS